MRLLITFLAFFLSATLYGQNDYSMSFDGVDDYVEITNANLFSNDNQFSLNVWVKISSHAFNNTESIMSKWSDNGASNNRPFHLQFSGGSNSIDFHVNGASSTVNMNISDIILNEWNMLTCIYDDVNGVIQFYHNGILKNQNSIGSGGNLQEYNNKMIIGSHTETTYEFFTGNIDNPSIWNIALTQEQIQNYMNCPPTGNEEGLLGYWNFEEGSGTTVFDQTSNGNDGTINGATWSTDVPEQNCQSGCTDSLANNFNPEANLDDGTCCYVNITQNDTTICEGDSVTLSEFLWNEVYFENFEDGQAQGWYARNGAAGSQSIINVDGNSVWQQSSDWNHFRLPIPGYLPSEGMALEIKAKDLGFGSGFGFRSNISSWNTCSQDGYTVHMNENQFLIAEIEIASFNADVESWHTYRIEDYGIDYRLFIDGVLAIVGVYADKSGFGNMININSGGPEWNSAQKLYIDYVKVEKLYTPENYLWSTGDTTATIKVSPTQTTTYWVERTENGVTCTDEVTITVQSTGCGNSDACNFTEGDACDIDCVFSNDCESLAALCGEGTVWDSETQECIVANPTDTNLDGCTDLNDLMDILANYGDCALSGFTTCGDPLGYQGYDYETVQIGEQCWFAENLRAENYRNGDAILYCANDCPWQQTTTGASSVYGDTYSNCGEGLGSSGYCSLPTAEVFDVFGRLYNWHAVTDEREVCPSGWSVPSVTDFENLISSSQLQGTSYADYMKSSDTWIESTVDVGILGFEALAGGYGGNLGGFDGDGYLADFWSNIPTNSTNAHHLQIELGMDEVFINDNHKQYALSVRCIKD